MTKGSFPGLKNPLEKKAGFQSSRRFCLRSWAPAEEEVYNPNRKPVKNIPAVVHEAIEMVAQYGNWLKERKVTAPEQLDKGQGAIISDGAQKQAIYKDEKKLPPRPFRRMPAFGGHDGMEPY